MSAFAMEQPVISQLKKELVQESKIPSLKNLILRKCAKVMFEGHPFRNINNTTNVLDALEHAQISEEKALTSALIEEHKYSLVQLFEPLPMVTINTHFKGNIFPAFSNNSMLMHCDAESKKVWRYDLIEQKIKDKTFDFKKASIEIIGKYVINYLFISKKVLIWDIEREEKVAELVPEKVMPGEDALYTSVSLYSNYLFLHYSVTKNDVDISKGYVEVFDTSNWQRKHCFELVFCPQQIIFLPNNHTMVVRGAGKHQNYCSVINYQEGKVVKTFPCNGLTYTSDNIIVCLHLKRAHYADDHQLYYNATLFFFNSITGKYIKSTDPILIKHKDYFPYSWGQLKLSENATFCLASLDPDIALFWDLKTKKGKEISKQAFSDYDGNGFFYVDNGCLIHKNFNLEKLSTIPHQDILSAELSPNNMYLIVKTKTKVTMLYLAKNLKYVASFPTNYLIISPLDTYALAVSANGQSTCYLLNFFRDSLLTLKEIVAFVVLKHQKLLKKPLNDIAKNVFNETTNSRLKNVAEWYFEPSLECFYCRESIEASEFILPCGHAQMHKKCLQMWRLGNNTDDCPFCGADKLFYYLTINNSGNHL